MSFYADLIPFLRAKPAIAALVGTRIYPQQAPQSASLPFIAYSTQSNSRDYHQGGASSMHDRRVQIEVWSDNYDQAQEVVDAIDNAVGGYSGQIGNTHVHSATIEEEDDALIPPTEADDVSLHRTTLTVRFVYQGLEPSLS